jgi:hypothetical protein
LIPLSKLPENFMVHQSHCTLEHHHTTLSRIVDSHQDNNYKQHQTQVNMSGEEEPRKKPAKVQSSLNKWFDKSKTFRTNKQTGRIETFEVTGGSDLVGDKHKCDHCLKTFISAQALGNHRNFCELSKARKAEEEGKAADAASAVFSGAPVPTRPQKNNQKLPSHSAMLVDQPSKDAGNKKRKRNKNKKTVPASDDRRTGNRGSSTRHRYSNEEKLDHLENLEIWQEAQWQAEPKKSDSSLSVYCLEHYPNEHNKWTTLLCKWAKMKRE